MPRLTVRPSAWREIRHEIAYLAEQAGRGTAERFLDAVLTSGDELAHMPRLGPLCGFTRAGLRQVRRWRVKGFENWLIFYLAKRDGVEIVHVMHGARDIEKLLDS